jgi:hypothetical protein
MTRYLERIHLPIQPPHLQIRGKLFYRLAQQAVQIEPVPFATLVKPQPVVKGGVK